MGLGHLSTVGIETPTRPDTLGRRTQADPTETVLTTRAFCMFACDIVLENFVAVNTGPIFGRVDL